MTASLAPRRTSRGISLTTSAANSCARMARIGFVLALTLGGSASAKAQQVDISSAIDIDANANFEVREETYELPETSLEFPFGAPSPDIGFPAEMLGVIVAPVNAPGPRPVALFIHGQSASCYNPTTGGVGPGFPCEEGQKTIPHYRGYLVHQRYLAARGWITVSISANGVNSSPLYNNATNDVTMRAELAEKHLRQWASWAAGDHAAPPPAVLSSVQPDLQRLMLIGHSRGGGAANQIALKSVTDSTLPWRVRAQVLIGPVMAHYNPAPLVPAVVLLPGCDGDVTDLQGQAYIDRARDLIADPALRSGIFIDGANHNFFNTEWDPATASVPEAAKDDSLVLFEGRTPEGVCRPGAPERLSGDAQRALGSFYIAAAGKALVLGENAVVPLFDGSPVCAGPSCRTTVRTHALGGRRQSLLIPKIDVGVTSSDPQMSVAACLTAREVSDEGACITADMAVVKTKTRTPHFNIAVARPEWDPTAPEAEPSQVALRMQWGTSLGSARIETSQSALSSDATHVVLRVIVPPEAVSTTFGLSLVDAAGVSLPLGAATLSGVPANAGRGTGVYWAQEARFAIDLAAAAAAGIDVNAIAALEITPQSASGSMWLLDAWSYASGTSTAGGTAARFEMSTEPVVPDASSRVLVPATVIGELSEPAEIYYFVRATRQEGTIKVAAGARTFNIELQTQGTGPVVEFVGIKGMVPTKREDAVTVPFPTEE